MSERKKTSDEILKELQQKADETKAVQRITVNKRTHRVRFENETEDEVTIVIEKEGSQK